MASGSSSTTGAPPGRSWSTHCWRRAPGRLWAIRPARSSAGPSPPRATSTGTGFAEVWLAVEENELGFRKEVALKLLWGDRPGEGGRVDELLAEARLVANLRHPNIVDVIQVGEVDGAFFLAMEYLDGGTLDTLLDRAKRAGLSLPRSVVLDLGIDVARALQHAHSGTDADGRPLCVIHRDLKPANVLLGRSGIAKVADFGIAKALGDATATAAGMLKGTPAYVAPESWRGERDFHPRVDLFALGCILYEMALGERLCRGDSVAAVFGELVMGSAQEDAARLRGRFDAIVPLVERLLERDPERRCQSAAEVVDGLQDLRAACARDGDVAAFLAWLSAAEAKAASEPVQAVTLPRAVRTTDPAWQAVVSKATGESSAAVEPARQGPGRSVAGGGEGEAVAVVPGVQVATTVEVPGPLLAPAMPPETPAEAAGRAGEAPPRPPRTTQSILVAARHDRPASGRARRLVLSSVLGALAIAAVGAWWASRAGSGSEEGPAVAVDVAGEGLVDGLGHDPATAGDRPVLDDLPDLSPVGPGTLSTLGSAASPAPGTGGGGAPTGSPVVARVAPPPADGGSLGLGAPPPTPTEPATASADAAEPAFPAAAELAPDSALEPTTPVRSAARSDGCLVLTSRPGGARVWIDGVRIGARAAGSPVSGQSRRPGSFEVAMGNGEEPVARVGVSVEAGAGVRVDCDLLVARRCTTSEVPADLCGR